MNQSIFKFIDFLAIISFGLFVLQWLSLATVAGLGVKPWLLVLTVTVVFNCFRRNFIFFLINFIKKYWFILLLLFSHQVLLFFFRSIHKNDFNLSELFKFILYFISFLFYVFVLSSIKIEKKKLLFSMSLSMILCFIAGLVISSLYAGFSLFYEILGLLSGNSVSYFTFVVLKSIFNMSSDIENVSTATTLKNTVATVLIVGFILVFTALLSRSKIKVSSKFVFGFQIIVFVLYLFCFLILMSRASFVIAFLVLLYFTYNIILRNIKNPIGFSFVFFGLFSFALIVIYKITNYFNEVVLDRTASYDERMTQYSFSMDFINSNVFLGGETGSIVIHNFLLSSWASGGIILFLISFSILSYFLFKVMCIFYLRNSKRTFDNVSIAILFLILLLLLRLMTGGGGGYISGDIWYVIAVIFSFELREKNSNSAIFEK